MIKTETNDSRLIFLNKVDMEGVAPMRKIKNIASQID